MNSDQYESPYAACGTRKHEIDIAKPIEQVKILNMNKVPPHETKWIGAQDIDK